MKKLWKKILCILILCFALSAGHTVVYATNDDESIENEVDESNDNAFPGTSPWLDGTQDKSIYSDSIDTEEEAEDIEAEKPGRVEKYFAELVRNTASSLIGILQKNISASLDRIVYGRVGSGYPDRVNIYSFELRLGNPYGVTGAVTYSILRSIVFILLAVNFVFLLAKSSWTGQTAKSREEIKTGLFLLVAKFSILMLMPFLLDVVLYIRDILLYGIKQVTGQMIAGGATLSVSKAFLLNAEKSGTFVDALMYLGTVGLTIYIVFIYVAIAIDMLVCFVSFPIMCVFHSKKKDLIQNWMMTMLSDIITPVIDAVLLLIPLLTSMMLSDTIRGVSIIQLVMCVLIIPARNRIKALLGVHSNERNGILGAMALMTLGRAVMGGIRSGAGKIGDIYSDMQKSRTHKELADADREEENDLLSAYSGSGDSSRQKKEEQDFEGRDGFNQGEIPEESSEVFAGESRDDSVLDNYSDTDGYSPEIGEVTDGQGEDGAVSEYSEPANSFGQENIDDKESGQSEDELSGVGTEASSAHAEMGSKKESMGNESESEIPESGIEADENLDENINNPPLTKSQALRQLGEQADKKQEHIDGLKSEKAGLMEEDRKLRRQMLDESKGSDPYREMERQRADIGMRTAAIDKKIADENKELNHLRRKSRDLQGNNRSAMNTAFDDKRAEILAKRATISNFETPEFQNVLTNEQKQKLYRRRAAVNTGKALLTGGSGMAVGAVLGGSSIFMGSSTASMMAYGGMSGASQISGYAADMATVIGRTGVRAGHKLRDKYMVNAGSNTIPSGNSTYEGDTADVQTPHHNSEPIRWKQTYSNAAATDPNLGPIQQETVQMKEQIQSDASKAMERVLGNGGSLRSSAGLRAMQRANIEAEKYIASMKEESVTVTAEMEREKRIMLQTEALTENVLNKMEFDTAYEKGTEQYKAAREYVEGSIKKIIEEKNKPIF